MGVLLSFHAKPAVAGNFALFAAALAARVQRDDEGGVTRVVSTWSIKP